MRMHPHPTALPTAALTLTAQVSRPGRGLLELGFRLEGDIDAVLIPPPAPAVQTDYLWHHTCFEAFVGTADAPAYGELNFSPSRAWAAYGFSSFRQDMTALPVQLPPVTQWRQDASCLQLEASLVLHDLLPGKDDQVLRIGLSAIIEEKSGRKSLWALHHAGDQPEFHDARGFVLELAPGGKAGMLNA
jgi:hypothetical protein